MQQTEYEQLGEEATLAEVDPLKHLYMQLRDKAITRSEIIDFDCTKIYHKAKIDKIKNGEVWRELIRGEVRTGKSTVGIKNIMDLNEIRYRFGKRKQRKDINECVVSDQTEFVRLAMKEPKQQAVLIDEYNVMAEGGANASTEEQILQAYGDMFASDGVDIVNCNPTRMRDPNAFIHLNIIGKIEGGYTRCELQYCNNLEGDIQTLGHVDIYVGDIIKNWTQNVRAIFEKEKITPEEEKYVEEQAKTDPYVKYILKKERRKKLLTQHHIRDIRTLEFARVTLQVYRQLHDAIKGRKARTGIDPIIVATTQDVCQEQGMIYSFYAETIIVNKIKSLLLLLMEVEQLERTLVKAKLDETRIAIRKSIKVTSELLTRRLDTEAKNCAIFENYLNIQ